LIDKNILQKIIKTAQIKKSENVLEVGPGKGVLTKELSARARRVLAVEKDVALMPELLSLGLPSVDFVQADILKFSEDILRKAFNNKPYRIVANLPYNISSQFLKLFLERDYKPQNMLLMLQREVAERICSKNGEQSVLSLSVQFYAKPKIEFLVKRNSFFPAPKVDSAIISISTITPNKFEVAPTDFFAVVKLGFSQKRKQLKNNLKKYGSARVEACLLDLGYNPNVRAEELKLTDWVRLVQLLIV
jgi:16S rRNA (adenine1518-N6/adenine1519-N6)-dimethyltransferase